MPIVAGCISVVMPTGVACMRSIDAKCLYSLKRFTDFPAPPFPSLRNFSSCDEGEVLLDCELGISSDVSLMISGHQRARKNQNWSRTQDMNPQITSQHSIICFDVFLALTLIKLVLSTRTQECLKLQSDLRPDAKKTPLNLVFAKKCSHLWKLYTSVTHL